MMANYNFKGDVAFKTKLLQLLTTNETGGAKQISPYELTWAGTTASGWSYGEVQYDLGQPNQIGRETFVDVLLNAKNGANFIVALPVNPTEK